MMDALFSLVYMVDDFPTRSLEYEVSGYRQLREMFDKHVTRYGSDPQWQGLSSNLKSLQHTTERYLPVTPSSGTTYD
jgi:hypothetical protein